MKSSSIPSASANQLVIIGNGFDLAHGLKTGYTDFMDWYLCDAFENFRNNTSHEDGLLAVQNRLSTYLTAFPSKPQSFKEVKRFIGINDSKFIQHKSNFLQKLLDSFDRENWVDIERFYFGVLISHFSGSGSNPTAKVKRLNKDFDFFISKFSDYIKTINSNIQRCSKLPLENSDNKLWYLFNSNSAEIKFLNFNYTDTLTAKGYANEHNVIHIHGRVTDIENNPIIFGYGDETDPIYQKIEDSGINTYLEHIKSFNYFRTGKYHEMLNFIDSNFFEVSIIGHSCGLSDRVLLKEIFEHPNCRKIEIYYHVRSDGSDNFKEITQEISRHFSASNKNMMRRRVCNKSPHNIIPQSSNIPLVK